MLSSVPFLRAKYYICIKIFVIGTNSGVARPGGGGGRSSESGTNIHLNVGMFIYII